MPCRTHEPNGSLPDVRSANGRACKPHSPAGQPRKRSQQEPPKGSAHTNKRKLAAQAISAIASKRVKGSAPGTAKRLRNSSVSGAIASPATANAAALARLHAVDATAQRLWQEAVSKRKPVSCGAVVYLV